MAIGKTRTSVLIAVGVCALLVAGVLAYVTIRDTAGSDEPDGSPAVATERVVSRRGGFSIAAPADMVVEKHGRTVQLTSKDKSLVINVGRGQPGPLSRAHGSFLRTLSKGYRRLEMIAAERLRIDGRPALTASGRATNASKVKIRFVVVTVKAQPSNYTIVAYAAADSDPSTVLPRVNAVANGFKVLR